MNLALHKPNLKRFYEEVAEKYPEEEIVYSTLRGILRKKFVLKYMKTLRGSLLDLGCNRGMYLREYKKGFSAGVDISWNVLKKAQEENNKLNLVVGDVENLGFIKDESFDNVLCSEVLEHVLNPSAAFKEIARLLKPGGRALITTPNYKKKKPHWVDLGTMEDYGVEGSCYFHTAFKPQELRAMAEDSNLKVIEQGTLEKEVKYAAKIPALIFLTIRGINTIFFKNRRLKSLNQRAFEWLSLAIYRVCKSVGLNWILLKFIRNGVRSFLLAEKG